MRARPLLTRLALGALLMVWPATSLLAGMSPEEQARRHAVVAHVGSAVVTAGELEDRLAAVPRFQLKAFGDSADAIRRKFFDQIILPEVLYALAAKRSHLEDQLPTSNKILRAESSAAGKAVIAGVRPVTAITFQEINAYYDANRAKYDTPERIFVFRILCATKEEAVAVLEAAKKDATVEAFTKLAHDHSIDKATSMRAGNLGYLSPDGTSSEAGLSVDPAIVKAAEAVKDGAFAPEPVPERMGPEKMGHTGVGYAVVWRRGTVPANHRSVQDAAAQIREAIWKEGADAAAKKHVEELRKEHLTELNESLLNGIEITPNEGDVVTHRRPGEVPPLTQTVRNAPHAN
jgi:peptidyl-prolyl cis-trans isomerase C